MTWFRVGGAGIPATLKNAMNAVFNKKFGTSGQEYPPKQWPDDVNLMGPLPEGTASGPIANFSDGADDVPVKSCVATIAPTLSAVSSVSETQTDGEEPPTFSRVYTANLGRAIYGGTADIVNGTGQEIYKKVVLDGTQPNNNFGLTAKTGYTQVSFVPYINEGIGNAQFVSDSFEQVAQISQVTEPGKMWNSVVPRLFFSLPETVTTQAQVNAYFAQNPAIIIYPVATPTDFTFDGQEINSLYGVNNFWNDAGGDTTVVYRRDIDLALQAVSSSRGLMMASRPVTQLVGEESDPDQVNELNEEAENTENTEEQEGDNDAR